jgi:hypothetical protein
VQDRDSGQRRGRRGSGALRASPRWCQGHAASGWAACPHVGTARGAPARPGRVSQFPQAELEGGALEPQAYGIIGDVPLTGHGGNNRLAFPICSRGFTRDRDTTGGHDQRVGLGGGDTPSLRKGDTWAWGARVLGLASILHCLSAYEALLVGEALTPQPGAPEAG